MNYFLNHPIKFSLALALIAWATVAYSKQDIKTPVHFADSSIPTPDAVSVHIPSTQTFNFINPVSEPSPLVVYDKDLACVTEAIYFEARGDNSKKEIVDVILNRVKSKYFPDSICEVINQPYQFSYTLDKHRSFEDESSKRKSKALAYAILSDFNYTDSTGGSLYYYNPDGVKHTPNWVDKKYFSIVAGKHKFYTWHRNI